MSEQTTNKHHYYQVQRWERRYQQWFTLGVPFASESEAIDYKDAETYKDDLWRIIKVTTSEEVIQQGGGK